ncbi:MAG: helix-turn-helix domain-containing protein [Lachnospiraceae bacterium]|jgi:transcriptional regulator with XRE-family HTH domain
MEFKDCLKLYMEQLHCSARDLSAVSGVSEASVSRYKNGERSPVLNTEKLSSLAHGLGLIAKDKGILLTEEEIMSNFRKCRCLPEENYDTARGKFNELITALEINVSVLAKAMNFDPSFMSRIRSGKRRPSSPDSFFEMFCEYCADNYNSGRDIENISVVTGCGKDELGTRAGYVARLKEWIFSDREAENRPVVGFLEKLDEFDLNEYIKVIRFDELKVPSVPVQLTSDTSYYGLEEMKKGELDFLKSTVLSKSMEPVFMCSDMDMEDMASDKDFGKKWMFGLAMVLKKGLKIRIIHNVERPFNELMLGLESWVPLYMTGQVEPYFLPFGNDKVYGHLTYVSGQAALFGECIRGFHSDGRYFFTRKKNAVAYYKKRADLLLSKSRPLMNIFIQGQADEYRKCIAGDLKEKGKRINYLDNFPIYTMSEELLERILKKNNADETERKRIIGYRKTSLELMEEWSCDHYWSDLISISTDEELEKFPKKLAISDILPERSFVYDAEDYRDHLEEHRAFEMSHPEYNTEYIEGSGFRNINLIVIGSRIAIVQKDNLPYVNFVIRHPHLVRALANYHALIKDE